MGSNYDKYDHQHWHIPTEEDTLDINFRAIVSDCRGLISGTLTPRPWSDISSTWNQFEPQRKKNITQYHKHKIVVGGIEGKKLPPLRKVPTEVARVNRMNGRRVHKMTRILVANGMEPLAAYTEASRLMRAK